MSWLPLSSKRKWRPYPSFLDHILHLLNSGILVVPSEIIENAEGSDLSASRITLSIDEHDHERRGKRISLSWILRTGLRKALSGMFFLSTRMRRTLTANRDTLDFTLLVHNCDVDVGREVSSIKPRCKVVVPLSNPPVRTPRVRVCMEDVHVKSIVVDV